MKILITGGNGVIGSSLSEVLISKGHDLTLLDYEYSDNTHDLECKKILADITIPLSYADKMHSVNFDGVIHLAAVSRVDSAEKDPSRCMEVNVSGTYFLLKLLAKKTIKFFIYVSSREVYGNPSLVPVAETCAKNPVSMYGISKLVAEMIVMSLCKSRGIGYTIVRLSNVYGSERDYPERVVPRLIRCAVEGRRFTAYGGNQILDLIFLDDALSCFSSIIDFYEEDPMVVAEKVFNIASGRGISVLEFARLVSRTYGAYLEVDLWPPREFDAKIFVADISKAKRLLRWGPRFDISSGILEYKARLSGIK